MHSVADNPQEIAILQHYPYGSRLLNNHNGNCKFDLNQDPGPVTQDHNKGGPETLDFHQVKTQPLSRVRLRSLMSIERVIITMLGTCLPALQLRIAVVTRYSEHETTNHLYISAPIQGL